MTSRGPVRRQPSGRDRLGGGRGNDEIRSKDGARDVVRCGAGEDDAVADQRDKLVGCET
jgi:hypothetical protein